MRSCVSQTSGVHLRPHGGRELVGDSGAVTQSLFGGEGHRHASSAVETRGESQAVGGGEADRGVHPPHLPRLPVWRAQFAAAPEQPPSGGERRVLREIQELGFGGDVLDVTDRGGGCGFVSSGFGTELCGAAC